MKSRALAVAALAAVGLTLTPVVAQADDACVGSPDHAPGCAAPIVAAAPTDSSTARPAVPDQSRSQRAPTGQASSEPTPSTAAHVGVLAGGVVAPGGTNFVLLTGAALALIVSGGALLVVRRAVLGPEPARAASTVDTTLRHSTYRKDPTHPSRATGSRSSKEMS